MPVSSSHRLRHIYHRRHSRYLLLAAAIHAVTFLLIFEPWDGGGPAAEVVTAARLASLFGDGDLDLADEFLDSRNTVAQLGRAPLRLTPEGFVADVWPLGATFMYAPFWLAARESVQWLTGSSPAEPFGLAYRFAISLASLLYGLLALLLIWRTACRFVSSGTALAAAVLTIFGSMAVTACFRRPAFPYAAALTASALFLYISVAYAPYRRVKEAVYVGLATGLMVMTEYLAFPFVLLPVLLAVRARASEPWEALDRIDLEQVGEEPAQPGEKPADSAPRRDARWRRVMRLGGRAGMLLVAVLAAAAVAAPQAILWRRMVGAWLVRPDAKAGLQPMLLADGVRGFFAGLPDWSMESWFHGLAGHLQGLLQWYPSLAVGFVGLLFMALRRRILGLALGAAVIAATAAHGFGLLLEPIGGGAPARFVFLVPFLALGSAWFLHEGRSRLVRAITVVVLLPGVAWNLVVTLAADRAALFAAPLTGGWDSASALLLSVWHDPFGYLGDSLLARYLGLGYPAPLETLVALLLLFFSIPAGCWVGLRYVLPVLRRGHGLKGFVVVAFAGIAALSMMIWESAPQPPHPDERAQLRVATEQDLPFVVDAATTHTCSASSPLMAYGRARAAWLRGDDEERRQAARALADAGLYLGHASLIDLPLQARRRLARHAVVARAPDLQRMVEERMDSLEWLTGRRTANRRIAEPAGLLLAAAGRREEALDWVEGAFLPSATHWRVRGLLARPASQYRLRCFVMALGRAPLRPENVRALREELRLEGLPTQAGRLTGRYVSIARNRLRLWEKLRRRYGEELGPDLLEVPREWTRFLAEVDLERDLQRLRRDVPGAEAGRSAAGREAAPASP